MNSKINVGIFLITSCFFFSCKKVGCMDEYALNYDSNATKENDNYCIYDYPNVEDYIPYYGEHTATLAAIDKGLYQTWSHVGSKYIDRWSNVKKARFYESDKNAVSAGDVYMSILINTVQDSIWMDLLKPDSENLYVGYGATPGTPMYFPNPLEWKATGGTWPAFDLFNPRGFSEKSFIQSGTPNLSNPYSFKVSPTPSADSLVLDIYGQRNHLSKVISASESSYVFSQQETQSLGKGKAYLRVVSVRYDVQTEGGKTYYFLNQHRDAKKIIIE